MLKVEPNITDKIVRCLEYEERQGNKVMLWELHMKLQEFCGEALSFDEARSEAYKMAEEGLIEIWFCAASQGHHLKAVPRHRPRVSFEGGSIKSDYFWSQVTKSSRLTDGARYTILQLGASHNQTKFSFVCEI